MGGGRLRVRSPTRLLLERDPGVQEWMLLGPEGVWKEGTWEACGLRGHCWGPVGTHTMDVSVEDKGTFS